MKKDQEARPVPEEEAPDSQDEAPLPGGEADRKPPAVIMTFSADYVLSGEDGKETASGQAEARLDEENLSILPRFGEALRIPLRQISLITQPGYTIELALTSKEKLTLSKLGRGLEDLFRGTSKLRNEMLLKDMLMNETVVKAGAEAEFVYRDSAGQDREKGTCEPRLYETALVVITGRGDLHRVPYSDIARVREEPYAVALDTEDAESFLFSRMGKELDPWKRDLAAAMNALTERVQASLQELLPAADPATIRKVARLMKEGRAARRLDIEAAAPGLWARLEKKLETIGLKDQYAFLKSVAREERMCIGVKRGLMGDLTGEYVWFLAPVYGTDARQPGNAVAMEAAASGEGGAGEGGGNLAGPIASGNLAGPIASGNLAGPIAGGRATYFFRIATPQEYAGLKSAQELDAAADRAIARISRCLLAINFRREPVYLSEEQMWEPRYARYQFAVQRIPELRELRSRFMGRVIHSSPEKWQQDIRTLLARGK